MPRGSSSARGQQRQPWRKPFRIHPPRWWCYFADGESRSSYTVATGRRGCAKPRSGHLLVSAFSARLTTPAQAALQQDPSPQRSSCSSSGSNDNRRRWRRRGALSMHRFCHRKHCLRLASLRALEPSAHRSYDRAVGCRARREAATCTNRSSESGAIGRTSNRAERCRCAPVEGARRQCLRTAAIVCGWAFVAP